MKIDYEAVVKRNSGFKKGKWVFMRFTSLPAVVLKQD